MQEPERTLLGPFFQKDQENIQASRSMVFDFTAKAVSYLGDKADVLELLVNMNFAAQHIPGTVFSKEFMNAAKELVEEAFPSDIAKHYLLHDAYRQAVFNIGRLFVALRKTRLIPRHTVEGAYVTIADVQGEWVMQNTVMTPVFSQRLVPGLAAVEARLCGRFPKPDYPNNMRIFDYVHYTPWTLEEIADAMFSMGPETTLSLQELVHQPWIKSAKLYGKGGKILEYNEENWRHRWSDLNRVSLVLERKGTI